jgi:hypothetical protein
MLRISSDNLILVVFIFYSCLAISQDKYDHQWVIGYDTTISKEYGNGILLNFNYDPVNVSLLKTINNFSMEGSNTSMCDENGKLLFYSNGCNIIDARGMIMENGDSINPGLVQSNYCPSGNPASQGVIALPAPGNSKLYYLFNLDLDMPFFMMPQYVGIAPERIYYSMIDMSLNSGLGKVVLKNYIALKDTFGRSNLQATKHANGIDWWLISPKSHTNCYFLTLLSSSGIQPSVLKCSGNDFNDADLQGQAVFSPDGKKFIRFLPRNGLNIYDFNNETGDLTNPIRIFFDQDTFHVAGVAVSANSRYLYASALKKLYQFDLNARDVEASKLLIAVWDGYADPYPTVFYLSALAPDGKIYIAGTSTHNYLHIIHQPNCPGQSCKFEQRGLKLPGYNFISIANIPQYRSQNITIPCDSIMVSSTGTNNSNSVFLYPNPAQDYIIINTENKLPEATIEIYDLLMRSVLNRKIIENTAIIDLHNIENGIYTLFLKSKESIIKVEKIIIEK